MKKRKKDIKKKLKIFFNFLKKRKPDKIMGI